MSNPFEKSPVTSSAQPIEQVESANELTEDAWVFQKYLKELALDSKFLRGKSTLDVGAHDGRFAKFTREQGISATVVSLDPEPDFSVGENIVKGTAESIPFSDEEFDLVISTSAIPNIYNGAEYKNKREALILQALQEMLRVARSEVRLGNVALDNDGEPYKQNYFRAVATVLAELEKRTDIKLERLSLPDVGTYVVRILKKQVRDAYEA